MSAAGSPGGQTPSQAPSLTPAAGSADAPFELTRRVGPDDLDELRHVNNVVYVRWMQDVAVAHWNELAPPGVRDSLAWVARRHEIDYLQAARLGDEVTLRTWVGHAEGLTFERFIEVWRTGDARCLLKARTLWVPIDPRSGRPTRVPADVRALVSVEG